MSIDIQKWKAEAHENAAKTVANMLQVRTNLVLYVDLQYFDGFVFCSFPATKILFFQVVKSQIIHKKKLFHSLQILTFHLCKNILFEAKKVLMLKENKFNAIIW